MACLRQRRSEQERRQKIALLKIQFQQPQVIDAQTQANEMLLKQCVSGYLPPSSLGANFDPVRKDSTGLFPLEVALWSLNMHLVLHIEKLLGEEKTQALWELLISKGISEASLYQILSFSRVDIKQIDNWYLETKNTAAERIYNPKNSSWTAPHGQEFPFFSLKNKLRTNFAESPIG